MLVRGLLLVMVVRELQIQLPESLDCLQVLLAAEAEAVGAHQAALGVLVAVEMEQLFQTQTVLPQQSILAAEVAERLSPQLQLFLAATAAAAS